jgi:hypothetical protein
MWLCELLVQDQWEPQEQVNCQVNASLAVTY